MKLKLILCLPMFLAAMVFAPLLFAQEAELEAAQLPLQNYIRAHESGNADFVRKAFSMRRKNRWLYQW